MSTSQSTAKKCSECGYVGPFRLKRLGPIWIPVCPQPHVNFGALWTGATTHR